MAATGQAIALSYGYVWVTGQRLGYRTLQNTNNDHLDWTKVGMWGLGEGEWDGCEELWDSGLQRLLYTSENDDPTAFHFHRGCDAVIGSGTNPVSSGPDQGVDSFWQWFPAGLQPLHYNRIAYYTLFLKLVVNNPQGAVFQNDPNAWADLNPVGLWRSTRCRLFDASGAMVGYAFTTNPAWHFVDINLRRKIMPEYNIDVVNGPDDLTAAVRRRFDWDAIFAAANYFDEILDNGNRRFEASYSFAQQTSLQAVLSQVLQVSRSYMRERNGQIGLYCDQQRRSVFTFKRQANINFSANDVDLHTAPNRFIAKFRDLLIPSAADIVSISAPDHTNPTVTTLNPHPFAANDRIVIGGTNSKYDANWVVATVPGTNSLTLQSRGSNYPSAVGAGGRIGLLYTRFKERSPEFNHHANQYARGAIGVGIPRQRNKVKVETDFATSTYDQVSRISYYQRSRALGPDASPYVTPVAAELTAPLFTVDDGDYTDVIDAYAVLGAAMTNGDGVPWTGAGNITSPSASSSATTFGSTGTVEANPSIATVQAISGQNGVARQTSQMFTFPGGGTASSLSISIDGTFVNPYDGSGILAELSTDGGVSFALLLSEISDFEQQTIVQNAGPYDLSKVIFRVTSTAMMELEGNDEASVTAIVSDVSAVANIPAKLDTESITVPASYSGPDPTLIMMSFKASASGAGATLSVNGKAFPLTGAAMQYELQLDAVPPTITFTVHANGNSSISVNNLKIAITSSVSTHGNGNLAIGIEPGDRITIDETLNVTYAGDYEVLQATKQLAGSSPAPDDSGQRSPVPGLIHLTLGPYSDNNYPDTSNPDEAGWYNVPGSQPGNDSNYTTIDLADGVAAFFSGSGADASTFSMPSAGFNPANLIAWASPQGYIEGDGHLHFIFNCAVDPTRLLHLIYDDSDGKQWRGDLNFAAITWRSLNSAHVSQIGEWQFVELTLAGGEQVCFGKGRVDASAAITVPPGYTLGNSICLAFPHAASDSGHPAHGFRAYVGNDGRAHHDYQDGSGNHWEGDSYAFFFGWKNNMGTVTAADGWVSIPLSTGRTLLFAGFSILDARAGGVLPPNFPATSLETILQGGKLPLPAGFSSTTLQVMTGANSFQITDNDCHGQKECFVDGDLNALTSFEDGEGHVWYGSSGTFALICDSPAGG